jgi:hypothetical protein
VYIPAEGRLCQYNDKARLPITIVLFHYLDPYRIRINIQGLLPVYGTMLLVEMAFSVSSLFHHMQAAEER